MLIRAIVIWLGLMILALINATIRELLISPQAGPEIGHVASTILLIAFIFVLAWFTLPWIAPRHVKGALQVGFIWFILTLAFEWLAGHYIFGSTWQAIINDYNVFAGRIWVLIPITTLLVPILVYKRRLEGHVSAT